MGENMKGKVEWVIKNENGQGMVEYSLILALVAMVVIGAVSLFGEATNQLYEKAISKMTF